MGDSNFPRYALNDTEDAKCYDLVSFPEFTNYKQYNVIFNINQRVLNLIMSDMPGTFLLDPGSLTGDDSYHPSLIIDTGKDAEHKVNFVGYYPTKTYKCRKANFQHCLNCFLLLTDPSSMQKLKLMKLTICSTTLCIKSLIFMYVS